MFAVYVEIFSQNYKQLLSLLECLSYSNTVSDIEDKGDRVTFYLYVVTQENVDRFIEYIKTFDGVDIATSQL